jgi:hypothetical protein
MVGFVMVTLGGSSSTQSSTTRISLNHASNQFTVQAKTHPRYGWVMLTLGIVGSDKFDLVLNTGLPASGMSAAMRDKLIMSEVLPPLDARSYVLPGLSLDGNSIPDLLVRVRPRLAQLGVDGTLGLDFLRQFTNIEFNVPTLRFTFTH